MMVCFGVGECGIFRVLMKKKKKKKEKKIY